MLSLINPFNCIYSYDMLPCACACVESMKSFVKTLYVFFTTENLCAHISKYLQLLFVCYFVGRSLKVCDIRNWMSTTPKLPKTPDDEHYERESNVNRLENVYFLWCGAPLNITVETSLSIELCTTQQNDGTESFILTDELNHFDLNPSSCESIISYLNSGGAFVWVGNLE